jgi:hypothetical protein
MRLHKISFSLCVWSAARIVNVSDFSKDIAYILDANSYSLSWPAGDLCYEIAHGEPIPDLIPLGITMQNNAADRFSQLSRLEVIHLAASTTDGVACSVEEYSKKIELLRRLARLGSLEETRLGLFLMNTIIPGTDAWVAETLRLRHAQLVERLTQKPLVSRIVSSVRGWMGGEQDPPPVVPELVIPTRFCQAIPARSLEEPTDMDIVNNTRVPKVASEFQRRFQSNYTIADSEATLTALSPAYKNGDIDNIWILLFHQDIVGAYPNDENFSFGDSFFLLVDTLAGRAIYVSWLFD